MRLQSPNSKPLSDPTPSSSQILPWSKTILKERCSFNFWYLYPDFIKKQWLQKAHSTRLNLLLDKCEKQQLLYSFNRMLMCSCCIGSTGMFGIYNSECCHCNNLPEFDMDCLHLFQEQPVKYPECDSVQYKYYKTNY